MTARKGDTATRNAGTERFYREISARFSPSDPLGAVCYPGAPRWFNAFLARFQAHAIERAWKRRRLDARPGIAVDFGCGVGRWSQWLAGRGYRVAGLDVSEEMLLAAERAAVPSAKLLASVDGVPLRDGIADAAFSVTVLQHLPYETQDRAVAEMGRLLRPGGTALLLEHAHGFAPMPHLYPRSIASWRELLQRNGLRVRDVRGEAYIPLVRLGYRALAVLGSRRRRSDATGVDAAGAPSWLSNVSAPVALATRLMIILSYPIEYAAMLLGPRFATNVLIVAEKEPSENGARTEAAEPAVVTP